MPRRSLPLRTLAVSIGSIGAGCASPGGDRFARVDAALRDLAHAGPVEAGLDMYWLDRRPPSDDDVDDATGGALWFAWGPWDGFVVPALEGGVGYSQHRVAGFRSSKLEIQRLRAGGKLSIGGDGLPLVLWARAGWFYRWSWDPDFDSAPFDQDGGGTYWGFGLEFAAGECRIGPFFELDRGAGDDDLEERFYGLSITYGH